MYLGKFKLSAVGQVADYSETPLPGGSVASQGGGATGTQLADWQGTVRAFYTGATVATSGAHAPFGETYAQTGGYAWAFTGQLGDSNKVNGTEYFPERQYRNSQGRWLSPDPVGMGAVNPSDPQSWNQYAYVGNSPLNRVDPQGTDWGDWGGGGGGGGGFSFSISFGSGGVSFGVGVGSTVCSFGVCVDTQPSQKLQAFARAIKDKNWQALLGMELGALNQNLQALGNNGCEFVNDCGGIGESFNTATIALPAAPVLPELIAACIAAEPCPLIVVGTVALAAAGTAIIHMSKGGKQNVADTGILNEAQRLIAAGAANSICDALQKLYDNASGERRNKIKRTQKAKGCRGH